MSSMRTISEDRSETGRVASMEAYSQTTAGMHALPVGTPAAETARKIPSLSGYGDRAFSNLDRWKGTLCIPGGGRQ